MVGLPSLCVIVLTRGDRPAEVHALDGSLLVGPELQDVELMLVGNGVIVEPPPRWKSVHSATNLGVPGGRDFGAHKTAGDVLVFIDDDAVIRHPELLTAVATRFKTEPDLGALAFKIVKSGTTNEMQRRWSPHIGHGDIDRRANVTTFVGGGHAIRRTAYDEIGGYYAPLFYGLEETDLSWRLLDAGWRIGFDPDLVLEHPDTDQAQHPDVVRRTAANRTIVARRNLPWLLAIPYVMNWTAIQIARSKSLDEVRQSMQGVVGGLRADIGRRAPISWGTAWRMAKLGRPPII